MLTWWASEVPLNVRQQLTVFVRTMTFQVVNFPVPRTLTRELERLCGRLRLARSGAERLLPRTVDGFSGKVYCESPQRLMGHWSPVPDAVHTVRGLEVPRHPGIASATVFVGVPKAAWLLDVVHGSIGMGTAGGH